MIIVAFQAKTRRAGECSQHIGITLGQKRNLGIGFLRKQLHIGSRAVGDGLRRIQAWISSGRWRSKPSPEKSDKDLVFPDLCIDNRLWSESKSGYAWLSRRTGSTSGPMASAQG